MAKQKAGYLGGFQGTLGPAIGYMWNGKWCVRSRPTAVHNPRTPEQVAQREMFKREVQLAADLCDAVVASMSDMARAMGMTSYNLFVSVNQKAFSLEDGVFGVDWQNLRLSMGDVAPVEAPQREMKEHNVLEVRYDKGHGYSHDLVHLMVYAPRLKRAMMSHPAFRKDRMVSIALPDSFVGEELQVWLLVKSPDGEWSESIWVPLGGEAVGSEELRVKSEESAGAGAGSEELRMKSEESAGAAMAEAPPE